MIGIIDLNCCNIASVQNMLNYLNIDNKVVIKIDPRYFRPTEVEQLLGDASKAHKELGWRPKMSLEEIIEEMIKNDHTEAKKELLLKEKGFPHTSSIESIPQITND